MKPDPDNKADPEFGTTCDSPTPTTHSGSDEGHAEVNKNELIPLTHKPPPPLAPIPDEQQPRIRLIHPFLLKIPMQIRYAIYGAVSSALFMALYYRAVERFSDRYVPSTIYAVTYLVFIPIQHIMASTMVFGWPDRYFPSLMSNVPIGLTAIAVGSYLTAFLDQVDFDETVADGLRSVGLSNSEPANNPKTEFYTSIFVLVATSLWSFLLSVLVNAPTEKPDKKKQ